MRHLSRNFGYGRRIDYAGRQVLREHLGGGHFSTQRTQSERWNRFARWLRDNGIGNMRHITPELVHAFADERLEDGKSPKTVANEISAANIVLRHASRGHWATISPSTIVGPISAVRTEAPASLDPATDRAAQAAIVAACPRAAAAWGLARACGMRIREASLADLDRLDREAREHNEIDIQEGTKGGRVAPRWIPVTDRLRAALAAAREARPAGSCNLLEPHETYQQWRNNTLRVGREALHVVNIRGYHDARAAYACQRYAALTGHPAPAVAGARGADKAADRAARATIAAELGHHRSSVTVSYVGSGR